MPTPLGHALGGMAAGWAVAGRAGWGRAAFLRAGAAFAVLGMLPDADLLSSVHRAWTHSLGAAAIAGMLAFAFTRHARMAVASATAYATHVVLDWAGADSSVPRGVMAFWPFLDAHYLSPVEVFESVWRRKETPDFWSHNIRAVARELAILVPPAVAVFLWRRPSRP